MSYSIARVAKVKSAVNTTGIQKHVQRENKNYNNKDIDHEKTSQNYDLIHGQAKQSFKELIDKRIAEGYTGNRKIRSDAIRHIDGIVTSDHDFFKDLDQEQVKKYFQDSFKFLENEYGKKNLLYATVHFDEATPHMHFGAVPLTEDGRLSAKDVVGNKKALTEFQDRYNQFMNQKGFQLERGESKQVTEKAHKMMDKYKQSTHYHENIFRQTHKKAKQEQAKLNELASALEPQKITYHAKETKAEIKDKLFGKSEIMEKETGNIVLTPKQVKELSVQVNAAFAVKKDYERLKNTDLARENKRLRTENKMMYGEWNDINEENKHIKKQNNDLSEGNETLKNKVKDLDKSLKLLYKLTKNVLKDRFKMFENVLKERAERGNLKSIDRVEQEIKKQDKQKENELSL